MIAAQFERSAKEKNTMNPLITKSSNGHHWKKASDKDRLDFCHFHAKALSKIKPVDGQFFFEALSALYDSEEKSVLDIELIQSLGLVLSLKDSQ